MKKPSSKLVFYFVEENELFIYNLDTGLIELEASQFYYPYWPALLENEDLICLGWL